MTKPARHFLHVGGADSPSPGRAALSDLAQGLQKWRIWMAIATYDIRARYRRSKLGQFWITLSMSVTIAALALVYSTIFKMPLSVYLPLMSISFIAWGLIASLVNESATVFIESEGFLKSSPLPKSMFIYRMLARNMIVFAHNLVLVPIVMAIFGIAPTIHTLLFIPAFALTLINGIWLGMLLGPLCTRFRDLPQIVASIVQIAFFASPVMWARHQLGSENQSYVEWNPFAIFLEILREPLLGKAPDPRWWVLAALITAAGFAIAFPFFQRIRARIAYYL